MQRTSRPVGSLRVEGIGLLLTMAPGSPDGIPDAAVVIRDGAIAWAGPAADLDTASCAGLPVLDAGGGLDPRLRRDGRGAGAQRLRA